MVLSLHLGFNLYTPVFGLSEPQCSYLTFVCVCWEDPGTDGSWFTWRPFRRKTGRGRCTKRGNGFDQHVEMDLFCSITTRAYCNTLLHKEPEFKPGGWQANIITLLTEVTLRELHQKHVGTSCSGGKQLFFCYFIAIQLRRKSCAFYCPTLTLKL